MTTAAQPGTARRVARVLACAATAILITASVLTGPLVSAAKRTVRDTHGDAPAKIDIVKATYINGPKRLRARLTARDLRRAGTMNFIVTQYATDEGFAAVVRYRKGRARAHLVHSYVDHVDPTRCKVAARWNARRDTIRVHFARRCLSRGYRHDQRNYLGVSMRVGDRSYDFAPFRHVKHG